MCLPLPCLSSGLLTPGPSSAEQTEAVQTDGRQDGAQQHPNAIREAVDAKRVLVCLSYEQGALSAPLIVSFSQRAYAAFSAAQSCDR